MAEVKSEIRSTVQIDVNGRQVGQMMFEGLGVTVYRSENDDVLVVEVGSAEVAGTDQREDGVPRLRILCNDALIMDTGEEWRER